MAKEWARAFYASKIWRDTRRYVLHRDHYTCVDCCGRAEEVHHKIELTPKNINDPNISHKPDNLESLCHYCHTRRTKGSSDIRDGYVFNEDGYAERYTPPIRE